MKKRYLNNMKSIALSFCILAGLLFPMIYSFLDISNYNMSSIENSDDTFIYSLNGKNYLAKYITENDLNDLKNQGDVREKRSNYSIIIDGHGTGYSMPSEGDLDSLIGQISLLELISDYRGGYGAAKDISKESYFPTVGDQGMQGSCSAWANAYYAYGYLEAKDYGWDASSGNPDYLLSPAWAYNIVAAYDYGSIPYEVAQVLVDWGIPTLNAMPYDDSDVNSWGNETAWRQAPYHRPKNYTLITYTGPTTIDLIKSLLDVGTPVTIGIDAYQFYNGLDEGTMDFILSSNEYGSTSLNHAQCFVGYDDTITEGSDVGAFRVVNSWGDWMDDGYYWLTYDAFAEFAGLGGQVIMFINDRFDYNPNIIATWRFSSAPTRMGDVVTLGVGPYGSPLNFTTPHYDYDVNNLFPEFMALDITEFYSDYIMNNDVFFYLEIGPSDTTGTISSFKLERYLGGILQEISQESPDVPKDTPGYVNATFMTFNHELKTYFLTVPTNPLIYNSYQMDVIIINNGATDETSLNFDLLLNGVPVHSSVIPNLPSGTNITVNYLWTPTEYDMYNFTAYLTPVPGEMYISNNYDTEIFYILAPIFYDDFESGLSKWVSISGLWHLTDISSAWPDLYHSPIHSMWFGNKSTGNYETGFRELGNITSIPIDLTETDIAFLEFYHWREGEGYGYDVSYVYISIDGINWDLIYYTDKQYIKPWEKVSIDISAYIGNPSVQLMFHFDTIDSLFNYYRGWLIDDVAIMGTGVVIPHDLRVSLEVLEDPELANSYTINATVTNIGTNDETSVNFYLYLNGIEVASLSIPNLLVGATQTISYSWTPTEYGNYNFTAYAPPVSGEDLTYNNLVTEIIHLHEIMLFDGMFLDYSFEIFGDIYSWNSLYSNLSEEIFHNDYSVYYGGSLYDMGHWDVDSQTRLMSDSAGGFSFGSRTHTPMWVFTDSSIGDLIPIAVNGERDHMFNITGDFLYDLPSFGPVEVWELEDLTVPGGIAWYEKSTGILLYGSFLYYGGMYNYTFNFMDTNAPFEYIIFDHNLKVSLDTPMNLQIDNSYIVNATVTNNGLNDEYDVYLFLYLDDIIVDSSTISLLPVGTSETVNYMWTPTEYRTYKFTAYAPPVPDETYTADNAKTKLISIMQSIFFDDFESGLTKWQSITGLWHLTNTSSAWPDPCNSPIHSMWFGNESTGTYKTGYQEFGELVSIPFNLSGLGIAYLEFYHWREGEGYGWDMSFVYISTNGIDWDEIYSSDASYIAPWEKVSLNISGYVGYPSVQLMFYFDTFDEVANAYRGWLVDDIQVIGLPPSLTLTAPNSFTLWKTGTFEEITWTSTGTISNVKVELFKDDLFVMEIVASTPNDGSYTWAIPSGLEDSTQYQIKVRDVSNPDIYDFSEYFEIYTSLTITVITPDSSSSWETGTSEEIIWTSTGTISDVKIELYKDDAFVMVVVASTPNDGSYTWAIPSGLEDSAQYQIKISDASNPSIYDYSEYFEIYTSPTITVITPDSSSSWETGTSEEIIWTSTGIISDVKIELYKDGAFVIEIVASTSNDGSYTWAIPSGLEDSAQYQIKISDASNPSIYDYSEYFEITTPAIPGYDPLILIGITGICVIILIKIRSRKELKIK